MGQSRPKGFSDEQWEALQRVTVLRNAILKDLQATGDTAYYQNADAYPFTNAELRRIAGAMPADMGALRAVEGLISARVERWGSDFLAALHSDRDESIGAVIDADPEMVARLRAFQVEVADREGIAPEDVLDDHDVALIAVERPASMSELMGLPLHRRRSAGKYGWPIPSIVAASSMTSADAVQVLEALLVGADPLTGELLASAGVLELPVVQDALSAAIAALSGPEAAECPPSHPVAGAHPLFGRRWSGDKPLGIMRDIKDVCPDHIVFVQSGLFWNVFNEDADACSKIFGWRTFDYGLGASCTGVWFNAWRFKDRLEDEALSYVLVAQADFPSRTPVIERAVAEVFTAGI